MPSFRVGEVTEILEARAGLQRVLVDLGVEPERAYVLTQLVGFVEVGNRVVVNTTAVDLGLGTGGWHVVHWNLARNEWTPPAATTPVTNHAGGGMKLRYTSLQVEVESAETPEVAALSGMPVVAAGLHSQVAAIAVAFKQLRPHGRLVYVMTDAGALPIAISDLVWQLRGRDLLDATVTCGHAFGGDFEAVTVYDALAAARHVAGADAVVVAMGPGSAGTASRLGFSAIEVGPVLDAAAALDGLRSAPAPPWRLPSQRHRALGRDPQPRPSRAAVHRWRGGTTTPPRPDDRAHRHQPRHRRRRACRRRAVARGARSERHIDGPARERGPRAVRGGGRSRGSCRAGGPLG